jgi:branched-chain amino acid transport system permease protein
MPWLTQYLQFLQEYRFIVFGPILVLLVIFVPHGIVGTYMGWRARREAEAVSRAASSALPAKAQPEAGHA